MSKAHDNKKYTRIHDYLLERVLRTDFKLSEIKLIFAIARLTYGWEDKKAKRKGIKRQLDRNMMSYQKLADMTNLNIRTVERSMKRLQKTNVVIQYEPPANRANRPGIYGLNSDDETWQIGENRTDSRVGSKPENRTDSRVGSIGSACRLNWIGMSVLNPSEPDNHAADARPIETRIDRKRSIERESGEEKVQKVSFPDDPKWTRNEQEFALEVFRRIGGKYYRTKIIPPIEMNRCLKFARGVLDDLSFGMECFEEAWIRTANWEQKNDRLTFRPWDILEQALFLFDAGEFEPTTEDDGLPEYFDLIYKDDDHEEAS